MFPYPYRYLPWNAGGQSGLVVLVEKTGHTSRLSRVGNLPGRFGSIETHQETVSWLWLEWCLRPFLEYLKFPSFPVISCHFPSMSRHFPSFPVIFRQCPVISRHFPSMSRHFPSFSVNVPSFPVIFRQCPRVRGVCVCGCVCGGGGLVEQNWLSTFYTLLWCIRWGYFSTPKEPLEQENIDIDAISV